MSSHLTRLGRISTKAQESLLQLQENAGRHSRHSLVVVPCYVNSRLTAMGIPVSCEVDIYGALSEFIGAVVSDDTVTLLDINNTVPADIYEQDITG